MRQFVTPLLLSLFLLPQSTTAYTMRHASKPFVPMVDNQAFRNEIISYVRGLAVNQINQVPLHQLQTLDATWNNSYQKSDWSVTVTLYHLGNKVGEGSSQGASLADVLKKATEMTLKPQPADRLNEKELNHYRFKVAFDYYPARMYSFIEYGEQGLELTGSRVAVRTMDAQSLKDQINTSAGYLLKTMHPQLHGFFKFYNAGQDRQQELLRTIYSSSSLYTLLMLYQTTHDQQLPQHFKPIADFILSNQVQDGPHAGGFYYGYNPETHKKSCVLVVGTTSKTMFTLLELNRFYPNEPKYLAAAKKAGDWLLTRINPDGTVMPIASCASGQWKNRSKQSFLYSGQVLSALSRLYGVTHDDRYHQGGVKIAGQFLQQLKTQGLIVGDDYRPANSISSSWVMMSLIDLAKVDSNPVYRNTIDKLASAILARQITDKTDVYSNGRYLDAMTASGNGWINEVMGVLHQFCKQQDGSNCQRYQDAMVLTSRWLLQNAYTPQNTYHVKNPNRAIGGFMTNFTTRTVRTDAVCHGVNSLIMLLASLGHDTGTLVNLPERPLVEILPLLRAGNGFL